MNARLFVAVAIVAPAPVCRCQLMAHATANGSSPFACTLIPITPLKRRDERRRKGGCRVDVSGLLAAKDVPGSVLLKRYPGWGDGLSVLSGVGKVTVSIQA